jgi:hypothetical protein
MRGRDFLSVARPLPAAPSEPHRRAAVIHAYYALMLECRDMLIRWGRPAPPRQNVHSFVRLKFAYARDTVLKEIGDVIDWLGRERNQASYEMSPSPKYAADQHALQCIDEAVRAISLLDAIDLDPSRRAAATASLPP